MKKKHTKIKIFLTSATGKMSQSLITEIIHSNEYELIGALVRKGSLYDGEPLDKLNHLYSTHNNIRLSHQWPKKNIDIVIDFSFPEHTLNIMDKCISHQYPLIIGTTGFSSLEYTKIIEAKKKIPIFMASNFSLGVHILMQLTKKISQLFNEGTEKDIIEYHHKYKKDMPSGTAISLKNTIKKSTHKDIQVDCHSIRAGHIIGKHQVIFTSEQEQITLEHNAITRNTFSLGALKVAKWLIKQDIGLYDMDNFLPS